MLRSLLFLFFLVAAAAAHGSSGPTHHHHTEPPADTDGVKMKIAADFGVSDVCNECTATCDTAESWDECYYCIENNHRQQKCNVNTDPHHHD